MNKEEIEIIQKEIDNKHLETQGYGRNLFVCKIVELERYIDTLQSQLDIANKKLDKIKEYCKNKNDDLTMIGIPFIETEFSHILSIIGGE